MVGVTAAYLGGVWDELLSLVSNVFLVIPALPLLIILLGYLPRTGNTATILVLAFLGWPWGARVIRAQTLAIRGRDFVAASRETGESGWRIISFEIVPNEVSLIAANFVNTVLYAIGTSVALAFIGLTNLKLEPRHDAVLGAEPGRTPARGLVVVHPARLVVALMGIGLALINFGMDESRQSAGRTPTCALRSTAARYFTAPTRGATPARAAAATAEPRCCFASAPSPAALQRDRTRQASAAQLSERK